MIPRASHIRQSMYQPQAKIQRISFSPTKFHSRYLQYSHPIFIAYPIISSLPCLTTSTIATFTSTHSLAHSNKKHQCWNSIQETHHLPHPPTVNQKAGKGRPRIEKLQIDYLHTQKSKETVGDVRVRICYKERKSHREIIAPNLWEADHQGEYREMGLDIVSAWDERRRARKLRM